ncbi:hypothetical protein F5Y09DRAFT_349580 [Xylaria sp. FL1042]|nr:hypothetical protein F5Y09DRAFT_349571 [Xylaria sp. FL1042]KAI0435360.1 hypothetical protein F5Y09DRAFT_349580 [Xylaria sp. FL1042]
MSITTPNHFITKAFNLTHLSTTAATGTQPSSTFNYAVTPAPTTSSSSYPSSRYPSHTLPGSCYTTVDDMRHLRTTVLTHKCYTHTNKVPAAPCPTLSCPPIPSDQICPFYISVSSTTVPCATDCCPTTSTVYKPDPSAPCPTCDPCRIPTEWITYTTGCPGTPTITEINYITPTYSPTEPSTEPPAYPVKYPVAYPVRERIE